MVDTDAELLRKYKDFFPTKYTYLKWIISDLGATKIMLKPNVKLDKQRPYCLNLKYKEKVRLELDKMLMVCIIYPLEESDLVSLMVL